MKSVKISLNRAKKSSISDAINKAEELLKNFPASNSIKADDIYLPLNHLFNTAAKRAMDIKVEHTVIERELTYVTTTQKKVIDQVRYFGAMAVGERNIFDAAQKVANQINQYANKGFVTGSLCKLLMIKFVTEPHQLERWAIVSYVALSPEGIEFMDKNPTKLSFDIGAVPLNSEDL